MKKMLIFILVISCLIILGCENSPFQTQTKSIELLGNPTTGYTWMFEVGDESVIKIDEKIQYMGKNGVTGAPSLFMYSIKSLKPGQTTLKFEYKRPWEREISEQLQNYIVTIKKNGKIVMKKVK